MAKLKGLTLFQKTGLLAFCLFGVISTLTSGLTAWTLYERMTGEYLSKGSAIASSIASGSQEILLVRDAATVQSMIDQYLEIEGVAYVFVVDGDGDVISHTFVPEMPSALLAIEGDRHGQLNREMNIRPFGRVIDICAPILAGVAGYVHVGMDKELIMDYFWGVVIEMQTMLFFVFWVCVGLLYMVTRRISRPLHQLTEYAKKLAGHDFNATIDIRTHDELELLGRTMQSMGQELALLFSEMESEVDKAAGDLREHMAYLSAIIDNLADGLLVVGVTGEITVLNPAMRKLFDLDSGEYRGFPLDDLFPPEVVEMTAGVRACNEDVMSSEIPLPRGRTGKAIGTSIRVTAPEEQCLGGVILVRDITREKELDQLKTDFISTVSHELRTPMTSVLGFSKIIKKKLEQTIFPVIGDNADTRRPIEQVRSNMGIIVTEAERLTELINDVLDIARMEAGKVQWRDQRVLMSEVIERSKDSTMGLWKSKGLAFDVKIEAGLPEVFGDYDRLVQVVVNLISNAVKFTDKGTLHCRARVSDDMVVVSVEDNGTGIDADDLGHVFDKFKQVGDTLTEKPAGTGLGLPICRQIVERHGGRIWVESEPNQGSTFSFSIPRAGASHLRNGTLGAVCPEPVPDQVGLKQEEEAAMMRGGGPLILVVDDDPSLISYLTQIFTDQGFRVKAVYNGHDAVVQAQVLRPDLITMDIMMPGMDGHEAIGCLRSSAATKNIPIMVITALSEEEHVDGDMALVKPVDEERVIKSAWALLERKSVNTTCMLLGAPDKCDLDGLAVMCTGKMVFSSVDTVWDEVDRGFVGVVFIPAEEVDKVQLEQLIQVPGISVVILPAFSCDE